MRSPLAYEDEAFFSRPQLYGGFGGFPRDASKFSHRGQRERMNIASISQALCLPWLLFCAVYATMSFELHFIRPLTCYSIVGAGLVLVLVNGCLAAKQKVQKSNEGFRAEPSWLTFFFFTNLIAWIMGVLLGNLNFWTNMQPYYEYSNLNMYDGVDPSRMRGQQVMDAGRVSFVNSTLIDVRRSIGFKNLDTYCVAPITVRSDDPRNPLPVPLASYEFWAVGLGCCSSNAADFHCGEYGDSAVHSGLRLLLDNQRDNFRLAVRQAEASYGIQATHPLFFFWTRDATQEMNAFRDAGYKYYLIGVLVHYGWQLLAVGLGTLGFSKLGHC